MKRTKEGVSLIVLVITIIVMIILASAVIMSLDNTNIISNASKAVESHNNANNITVANMFYGEYIVGVETNDPNVQGKTAEQYVKEKLEAQKIDVSTFAINKDGDILFGLAGKEELLGREYDEKKANGTLAKPESPIRDEYILQNMYSSELYLGATINYDAGVSGYTGTWQLLRLQDGKILLVSSEAVQQDKTLTGVNDYNNGIKILDDICKPFGNGKGAVSARSITAEDINDITGFDPMNAYDGKRSQEGRTTAYGYKATYTGISSTSFEATSTNPALYDAIGGKKVFETTNGFTKLNGQKLQIGEKYSCENTYYTYSITGMNSKHIDYIEKVSTFHDWKENKLTMTYTSIAVQDMIMPEDTTKEYWLATKATWALASNAGWGLLNVKLDNGATFIERNSEMFNAVNGVKSGTYDVRAVVLLDADVELVKLADGTFDIK